MDPFCTEKSQNYTSELHEQLLPKAANLPTPKPKYSQHAFPRSPYLYISISLLAVNILQAYLWLSTQASQPRYHPKFSSEPVEVVRNKSMETLSSAESNRVWSDSLPGVTGWVQIAHPTAYNLPPGIPSIEGEGEVYITTWGHQHHCLKTLRKQFSALIRDESPFPAAYASSQLQESQSESENHLNETLTPVLDQLGHIMHCFDYLRQTVACQSDVTLEGITGESSARNYEIDGYDVMHTCKNQRQVGEWLVDHRPLDEWTRDFEV